ncbi:WSC domain-containing protein [Xylariomycetidae sp. FL0641]|nr:WSC domain-containing protein [Xylariomycetidae sp. FL0641]
MRFSTALPVAATILAPFTRASDVYSSRGCYVSGPKEHALGNKMRLGGGLLLTTDLCFEACMIEGYAFVGTKGGDECWCDMELADSAVKLGIDACDTPCVGNPDQMCGGEKNLNIYETTDPH